MRPLVSIGLAGALAIRAWAEASEAATPGAPAVLTCASQVLGLSEEQAARGLPVRLRGVVVGDAPPVGRAMVLWDTSEYIYVQVDGPEGVSFRRGDLVEVEGISGAGGFAPLLYLRSGRKLGTGTLPAARELTAEQLLAGQFDAQWVRVRGIVRQCEPSETWAGRWRLTLALGGQLVAVHVDSEQSPAGLIDAEVAVDGLYFNQHNVSRQFVRAQLFVPSDVPVTTLVGAPEDAFAAPVRPVRSLLQFERHERYGHRLHVQGTVLHQEPGGWFWIRDGDHGLRVASRQAERLAPGDRVDVLGFPTQGGYTPRLEDAVFRFSDAGAAPPAVEPADVRGAVAHDSDLLALEARLVEARRTAEGIALVLDWQGLLVPATLALPEAHGVPAAWSPGSTVRVTGLCTVPLDDPAPAGGLLEPDAFELRLRTVADLAVLQPPPWWGRERILWALGIATGVSILAAAAVWLTARRRLQEQAIRRGKAEAEFAAILAERNRVAREIHDTLAQGLGAISMQLELAKNAPAADRGATERHLEAAHRLVRENLADARASIWNMRSQALESHDLPGALEGILRQLSAGRAVAAEFKVSGTSRRLAPQAENELLRIGQEAITNALRHGAPQNLAMSLVFGEGQVELVVTDDGSGFDPEQAPGGAGRFGLVGMRERAGQLGALLEITSAPGRGTRVALCARTPD
ncbi:MAG: sensor histidine kinase [Opitutaceae bacterium]|nr:sensor histidine kinase [Opitutaceae bacterium]